jgi:hypothetical protein
MLGDLEDQIRDWLVCEKQSAALTTFAVNHHRAGWTVLPAFSMIHLVE